jgi:hypothetical protein
MQTPRPRKIINMSLDPELVDWLNEWRKSQTAVVPFGRAVDACIRALRETENSVKRSVPKGKASS